MHARVECMRVFTPPPPEKKRKYVFVVSKTRATIEVCAPLLFVGSVPQFGSFIKTCLDPKN